MNLNEINFSFDGKHCLGDFGCIYVEDGGHIISPPVKRNTYEIAGVDGTVELPGETYGEFVLRGALYFMQDHKDQASAQQALRKISAWLRSGRKKLIFDYEPDVYYLASVNAETEWTYDEWIEGGLSVEFSVQPFAYNVRENLESVITSGTEETLLLVMDTGPPAPLCLEVENLGTAAITGVTVTFGDAESVFSGMNLAAGGSLTISLEAPAGAVFADGENALPYADVFDTTMAAAAGPNEIMVAVAYGAGTRSARITARGRGRFV